MAPYRDSGQALRRIGIFGGTFDPVHKGHIAVVKDFARSLGLDTVFIVPASMPPHKPDSPTASADDRLSMLKIAAAGVPFLRVSDLELRRMGKSYTIDTVIELQGENPGSELYLALGADAFQEISTWHRPEDVAAAVNIVVMTRPGFEIDLTSSLTGEMRSSYNLEGGILRHASGRQLLPLEVTAVDISASMVREIIAKGGEIKHLVPEGVGDYIVRKGLYR